MKIYTYNLGAGGTRVLVVAGSKGHRCTLDGDPIPVWTADQFRRAAEAEGLEPHVETVRACEVCDQPLHGDPQAVDLCDFHEANGVERRKPRVVEL